MGAERFLTQRRQEDAENAESENQNGGGGVDGRIAGRVVIALAKPHQ